MVGHKAAGKGATHPRTGVNTVLAHTGQVAGTLGAAHALRLAFHVGVALVVADALAGGGVVALSTLGVDAAWRGIAGLDNFNRPWSGWKQKTHIRQEKI